MSYNDSAPWPAEPDGTGPSLGRLSADVYGDDPGNWQATPASPGRHPGFPPTTYESWASANALGDGPEAARLADFESDGMINLLEFALGGDPNTNDLEKLPSVEVRSLRVLDQTADYLTVTYRKRRDAPQLVYSVQVSNNLLDWEVVTSRVGAPVSNGDGTDSITVRDDQPIATGERRFIRLVVSDS